jgi:hypothetical protein
MKKIQQILIFVFLSTTLSLSLLVLTANNFRINSEVSMALLVILSLSFFCSLTLLLTYKIKKKWLSLFLWLLIPLLPVIFFGELQFRILSGDSYSMTSIRKDFSITLAIVMFWLLIGWLRWSKLYHRKS